MVVKKWFKWTKKTKVGGYYIIPIIDYVHVSYNTYLYFWINRALELKENEDDEIEGECRDIKKSYGPQTDEERRRLYNLMKY